MMKKIREHIIIKETIGLVVPHLIAFFLVLLALRIFEITSYSLSGTDNYFEWSYLFAGAFLDLGFASFVVLIVIGIQSFLFTRHVKNTVFLNCLLILILLFSFLLSLVFTKTYNPLDEVFYSFSYNDLRSIISGEANWLQNSFEFIILLIIYFFTLIRIKRLKIKAAYFFSLLMLCSFIFSPSLYYVSNEWKATKFINNKAVYFMSRSYIYFLSPEITTDEPNYIENKFLGGPYLDKDYPLMHKFKIDSDFSNHFSKTNNTPPNIVIIIVESLATRLIGKYANQSGHLMPFLDSLCTEGLYFPNIISTAERTYNVLPALLSSTPNTPGKNYWQSLIQPRHWSMMTLLKEQYYSRFYCGVDLNFNKMIDYMNFHETDYIVNSWEKEFNLKFDKKNWWGYPDDQLFDKSNIDLFGKHKKLDKPRLDIFLTISTHPPYIIPYQKRIKKELLEELSKIKNKTKYHDYMIKNADAFTSYRYTDESIRSFFEKVKKDTEYSNTIFIITGDHGPYIETPEQNALSRAAVPIIIVSDLLKKPVKYEAISSHLDILPSILGLLNEQYDIDVPTEVPFMGKGLRLNKEFETNLYQPIGADNFNNNFMIYGNYFLEHKQLYKIKPSLVLEPINNDKIKQDLLEKMKSYNQMSSYCIFNDKIVPEEIYLKYLHGKSYQLYDYKFEMEINSSDEFISFKSGKEYLFDEEVEHLKIEISVDIYTSKEVDIATLPFFSASLLHNDSLIKNHYCRPKLNQMKFKKGWNQYKYSLEINPNQLSELDDLNLKFYIWNKYKVDFKSRNIYLKTYMK